MPHLATTRRRRRGPHRSPGWWPRPRTRGRLTRIAPAVAAALCVLALFLVLVPVVISL